jgi:hypothetical protein
MGRHREGKRLVGANPKVGGHQVTLGIGGKQYQIGNFKTAEEASSAYFEAANHYEKTGEVITKYLKKRDLPKNIHRNKNGKPYTARYDYQGKKLHLGRFDTVEDAEKAINQFRKERLGLPPQPDTGRHRPCSSYFLKDSLER